MSIKKGSVLVLIGVAALTFGASYGIGLWLSVGPKAATAGTAAPPDGADAAADGPPRESLEDPERAQFREKQLTALIRQVRTRLQEVEKREADARDQERRLGIAQQDLQQQAQQMETLRGEMAAALTQLKQAQAQFERDRVAIGALEAANLKRTAGVYDRMDAEAAAQIIESMCQNNQEADAVKILYFMQERTVAKVLAALTDRKTAAGLCDRMKQIKEER